MNRYHEINESSNVSIMESRGCENASLYDFQREAIESLNNYFSLDDNYPNRSGLLVMPTGSGKTYTAVNWILKDCVARGYQVLWLVHRIELVTQAYDEIRNCIPLLKNVEMKDNKTSVTILPISGDHIPPSMAKKADVYVASIASLANDNGIRFLKTMVSKAGREKLVVVIDEAHHSVTASYQRVLERLRGRINPNLILLGLTATPYRMAENDQQKLQQMYRINLNMMMGNRYRGFVYEVKITDLIANGTLSKPIFIPVSTNLDGVREFSMTEAAKKYFDKYKELSSETLDNMAQSVSRNRLIVDEYIDNQEKYGKTLVFALNQDHAERLCEMFKERGVECDFAVSFREDAQAVIKDFKENKFKVLVNVNMLTEGSDVPDVQTVFLTRQTNSESLLAQMIGRALRGKNAKGKNASGTENAYVVAFHDIWDSYMKFLEPNELIKMEDADDDEPTREEYKPEIAPRETEEASCEESPFVEMVEISQEDKKQLQEIVKELIGEDFLNIDCYDPNGLEVPHGWYSIIGEDGSSERLLVFESQLGSYRRLIDNMAGILKCTIHDKHLVDRFFSGCRKPFQIRFASFMAAIRRTGEIPGYFTFSERDELDLVKIVAQMVDYSEDREMQGTWLRQRYVASPILRELYRTFDNFRLCIENILSHRTRSELATIKFEKKPYRILPNYYDLEELLNEVLAQYPLLRADTLEEYGWSRKIVFGWFGLCNDLHGRHQIHISRMMSSPDMSREAVKYVIFHELLHANGYWDHDMEFRSREWQYPNSEQLDQELNRLMIDYDLTPYCDVAVNNEEYLFRKLKQESEEVEDRTSVSVEESEKDKLIQILKEKCEALEEKVSNMPSLDDIEKAIDKKAQELAEQMVLKMLDSMRNNL